MAKVAAAGISFELTPEQRELRDLAHDFAERELRPIAREWDDREDCPPELSGRRLRSASPRMRFPLNSAAAESPRSPPP